MKNNKLNKFKGFFILLLAFTMIMFTGCKGMVSNTETDKINQAKNYRGIGWKSANANRH